MARGTLQVAWINKGEGGEEHYHVMFGKDGDSKTLRARSVKGRHELAHLFKSELKLADNACNSALNDLDSSGQASLNGMEVSDDILKNLDLA